MHKVARSELRGKPSKRITNPNAAQKYHHVVNATHSNIGSENAEVSDPCGGTAGSSFILSNDYLTTTEGSTTHA